MSPIDDRPVSTRPPDQFARPEEDAPDAATEVAASSTSEPCISIIMANYNGANWIGDAIASVQKQSLKDWELIVVDDASSDASVDIVRAAANSDPRIVLLTSPRNGGPSVARNRALASARGRWVTVVDSDDLLAERRLELLIAKAESDNVGLAADDLHIMNENGLLTGHTLLGVQSTTSFDAVGLINSPQFGYLKPIIRTRLLAELWYDERVRSAEDFDLLLRALVKHDANVALYPGLGYHYRRRSGSLSTDKSADRPALRGMLEANARFRASHVLSGRLAKACAHRHRALENSLRWVDVTEAVREKRFVAALRHTMDHPTVLSCAVTFVKKRLYGRVLRHNERAETLGL